MRVRVREDARLKRFEPAEARSVDELPQAGGWQYEPKWDGFRCIAVKRAASVQLWSKSDKPLDRYFPEIVAAVRGLAVDLCVLDGELVIRDGNRSDFDELLQRIHPAQSCVRMLAQSHPAHFIVFDMLAEDGAAALDSRPLAERRAHLEAFAKKRFPRRGLLELSPVTRSRSVAERWLRTHGARDGVVAKLLDQPYRSGSRDAMVKVKRKRTADCVVGGFRYASKGKLVGSLLLGLYDREGLLDHVGFMSGIRDGERAALTKRLEALKGPPGFTGTKPGGPSRWSTERSEAWEPLRTRLVVEVEFDHVTGDRFRHGTRFVRWRPDKKPAQCSMDQLRA
jgi:ATP-dependent DNA ligase